MSTFSPAAILYSTAGTAIATAAATPAGTELGIIVRSAGDINAVVNAANSTTTPLAGGGVFTGTSVDTLEYSSITWSIASDVVSAASGIEAQFSPDGTNWDTRKTSSYGTNRIGKTSDLAIRTHDRYFRIKYTNGAGAQGYFRLQTQLSRSAPLGDTIGVDQAPASGDDASLVKAVITGKLPVSEGGSYTTSIYKDVAIDAFGAIKVSEGSTHSAFGALLVAPETVKINVQFPYAINTRLVTPTTANGGTVTQSTGRAVLQTSTAVDGSAKMETIDTIKYTPGQGIICRFTAVFTTGVASSRQEIGIGDDSDGYFFGFDGTAFGVCRRVGGSDNWIAQTAWNGDDKFDGTGPSGHILDPTKGYPYQIQFQWLGFGAIRYFLEDPYTGDFVLVHTIRYAGTATVPSVNNPTLPLHAKVINTGNNTNLTLYSPSMGALSEGTQEDVGSNVRWAFTQSRGTVATTGTAFFSMQNKATNVLGGTNTNRVIIHVDSVSYRSATNKDMLLGFYRGATITSPTWVDVSTTQSVTQTDVAGTADGTGGIPVYYVSVAAGTSGTVDLSYLNLRIQPGQIASVIGFGEGASGDGRVSLSWHEEF